jgi:hypothetical protein
MSLIGWERVSKSFFFRLMVQIEIPSIFLFYEIVQNGIEHFYLPQNGLERNSKLFPFRETDRIPVE